MEALAGDRRQAIEMLREILTKTVPGPGENCVRFRKLRDVGMDAVRGTLLEMAGPGQQ